MRGLAARALKALVAKFHQGHLCIRWREHPYSIDLCPNLGGAWKSTENYGRVACQYFYECSNCKTLLRPKPGDCCVFCSYGSKKCPPMQDENRGCWVAE